MQIRKLKILAALVLFGVVLICNSAQAEIYKWIDEKGTVHYSEDPNAVPEKYKNKAEKKDIDEFPPLLPDKPKRPQSYNSEPSSNPPQRSKSFRRIEGESVGSGPSPGFIPFDKFKYLTEGMSEAEVLSRFGSPTRIEQAETQTKGSIDGGVVTGFVSPGGSMSGTVSGGTVRTETILIKRYYYIGDHSKGEKTTIIHIKKGKVFKYERI